MRTAQSTMRTPLIATLVLCTLALAAMVGIHALGEASFLRGIFYVAAGALVAGVVWVFRSGD